MATTKNVAEKKVAAPKQESQSESLKEQMKIQPRREDLAGVYSNFTIFKHTKHEFITEFVWRMDSSYMLVSRIITSPQHAKAIYKALGKNIEIYESANGVIEEE